MKVVAVVVTYNRIGLLKENIRALTGQTWPAEGTEDVLEILVVDNHSSDGTAEWLNEQMAGGAPRISALFLEENLGGAGGFYYGMKRAAEDLLADFVWIMDDDTMPDADALLKLIKVAKELQSLGRNFGYLASKVLWKDGSTCKMNRPDRTKANAMGSTEAFFSKDGVVPITRGTFVSLLIPKETIGELGLPIKEYFIWGDDKEYTLRISDRYPCYLIESSTVLHLTDTNEGSSICSDAEDRIDRYFYAYRNDYITARKRSKKEVVIYYLAFWLNELRIILCSGEKKQRLSVMRKGRAAGRKICEQKIPF